MSSLEDLPLSSNHKAIWEIVEDKGHMAWETSINKSIVHIFRQKYIGLNLQYLVVKCQFSNCSWQEQVNFQWDDDEVRFVLDQHAKLDFFYNASSLKQQSSDRHVTPSQTHYTDSDPTQYLLFLLMLRASWRINKYQFYSLVWTNAIQYLRRPILSSCCLHAKSSHIVLKSRGK